MKKIITLLLLLSLLAAAPAGLALTTIDPAADRGISPARGLPNNPVIPGESMTTGLPFDGTYVPVLVNIDNVAGAWPQWGIAQADIIYEMPIHSHTLTRLMALFTHDHPQEAGPLRSGRVLHAEMRQEWGAAWAFAGIQRKDGSNVNVALREMGVRDTEDHLIFDVNTRDHTRLSINRKHHKAPHNHSFQLGQAAELVKGHAFPARPFLFDDALPTAGDAAISIRLLYGGGNENSYTNSEYRYDAATNLYTRTRQGKPYVDMNEPETPLTFSNVIVQWANLTFNGAANAPLLEEVGEGNADIFLGGRHISGYWVRETVDSRTVFYDQDGNEIRLQRGKTWINITSPKSTVVIYE